MPAPTMEKISAWLELEGMANRQVMRFQVIAEMSAAATSCCVGDLGRTIPLADRAGHGGAGQRADQVEHRRHTDRLTGERTRVATEVAMALAVS